MSEDKEVQKPDPKEVESSKPGEIQPFKKEDVDPSFVKRYFKQNLVSMSGECGSCYKRCPNCPYESEFESLNMKNDDKMCKDEVSKLAIWFKKYKEYFNIPNNDVVGLNQLRRLLQLELKLYRLELDDDGDYWGEEIAAITLEGDTITDDIISKKEEYQEALERRRRKEFEALAEMYEPDQNVNEMTYGDIAQRAEIEIERKDGKD